MNMHTFAKQLVEDIAFGHGLSRVVELGIQGQCICQQPEPYRRGFKCPVHQPETPLTSHG